MDEKSGQWISMGEAASPKEAEALRAFRTLLADSPTTWAWSNLMFSSPDGRMSEVDVLLLNRNGLFLLEFKGLHGQITGNQQTWTQRAPNGHIRTFTNPRFATRSKAQRLASLMENKKHKRTITIPFVHEIVVLHGRDSQVSLDDEAAADIYALDGYNVAGLPPISNLLASQPWDDRDRITKQRAVELVTVLTKKCHLAKRPRKIMVGQYELEGTTAIGEGPTWQDRRAVHPVLTTEHRRIRLYDVPPDAPAATREAINRAARREYLLTNGLNHPGIVAPLEIHAIPTGPTLVFPDDSDSVPLDDFLEEHGDDLDLPARLDLIRKLAEVLAYAHRNQVHHRALTPAQIRVVPGKSPQVRIRDWQTGRGDPDEGMSATRLSILAGASQVKGLVGEEQYVYLAPEALADLGDLDAGALDVYGIGAVAYRILTGAAPAANLAELQSRMRDDGGLNPAVIRDDVTEGIGDLIEQSTQAEVASRLPDVDSFLQRLSAVEREQKPELSGTSEPTDLVDPLEAQPGDLIGDDLIVEERLGSGSTGLALLVSDGSDDSVPTVMKVAHDAEREPRLVAEADVLGRVDHPRIVNLLSGPTQINGRLTIMMADAGRPTLGRRLHDEGRLTIEQLQNYGHDLFEVAHYLELQGVHHRDIKPDNLGVRADRADDRRPRLVLFDFSLANESPDHIEVGTRGYLDPFLGHGSHRPRYDSSAERFAVAATLFHMATGQLPEWGDGTSDPAMIDEEVTLTADWFEDQIAGPAIGFFGKALARDARQRFGDLTEMAQSWDRIFTGIGVSRPGDESSIPGADLDAAATEAVLETGLAQAGLTPRAISALARLGVASVAELIAVPAMRINQLSGVGAAVRREIQRRRSDWVQRLTQETAPITDPTGRGVETVAASLIPGSNGRNDDTIALATALLRPGSEAGTWPTWDELGSSAGLDEQQTRQARSRLLKAWTKRDLTTQLREELAAAILSQGGIATVAECARLLVAIRGSVAHGEQRVGNALPLVRVAAEIEHEENLGFLLSRPTHDQAVLLALAAGPDDPLEARVAAVRELARTVAGAVGQSERPLRPIRSLSLVTDHPQSHVVGIADPVRVLALTAATSPTAAVSGRGELYRRGLSASDAVATVLSGRVGRHEVAEAWLIRTVAARFPAAEPVPGRPELDALVAAADPELSWSGHLYTSMRSAETSLLPPTSLHRPHIDASTASLDRFWAQLRESLASHSAEVLVVQPGLLTAVGPALTRHFDLTESDVTEFNVTEALLPAIRRIADHDGIEWEFLLQVDASAPDSSDRDKLNQLVRQGLDEIWEPVRTSPEPMVLTDVAPIARYGAMDLLDDLVNLATKRPAARWVVVPHRSSAGPPKLEERPMPLPASRWMAVPETILTKTAPRLTG